MTRIEMEFKQVQPATSLLCLLGIQLSLVESISGIVQDLSIDYVHTSYFAHQRYCYSLDPEGIQ